MLLPGRSATLLASHWMKKDKLKSTNNTTKPCKIMDDCIYSDQTTSNAVLVDGLGLVWISVRSPV